MWFLCLRRPLYQPRDQWTTPNNDHLAWMKTQHEAGKIYLSGPGIAENERFGMYLIRADSKDEAAKIAASDPFTVAGHCGFELIQWEIHQIMGAGSFVSSSQGAPAART